MGKRKISNISSRKLLTLLASFLVLVIVGCKQQQPSIIAIAEDMIINESGSGEYMNWFDEQDSNGVPGTIWKTEAMPSFWPASIVINLGCKFQVTEVWVFDGNKEPNVEGGKLQLASGLPFDWQNKQTLELQNIEGWVKINWKAETQFIQLQKQSTVHYNTEKDYYKNYDLSIKEVIIKGYALEKRIDSTSENKHTAFNISMDQFIGMNSYINTVDKVHEAVGLVREYRPWRWNGVKDLETPINWGKIKGSAGGDEYAVMEIGNSDGYYQKMKNMEIECVPCIHRHVDEEKEHENIPCFDGDPNEPFSYKIMSDYSFQFAARYGNQKVSENLLRTTEPSPKKSGMGLIRYFENWNEPNRWWGNPAGHFTPYQFAAFCSASYDGHLKQMGAGFGVKNADPDIKYVLGGLANMSMDYVKAMKAWSDKYRNGSFPADVINFHHYCNTLGKQHSGEKDMGISPEAANLKEMLLEIVKWRNANLPSKEIWLSEFGWDTDENTYISAAHGHKLYPEKITMEEIQAQWIVREYLIGAGAGLDRMMMFLANDLKNYPHGVYGKCGFITVDEEYKPSWYYVKTLKNALAEMLFEQEIDSGTKDVWIYKFHNPNNNEAAYVLWCPTSDGTKVDKYDLRLPVEIQSVTSISLVHNAENGQKIKLKANGGIVKVNVNERPVIILTNNL